MPNKKPFDDRVMDLFKSFLMKTPYTLWKAISWVGVKVVYWGVKSFRDHAMESLTTAFSTTFSYQEKARIAQQSFESLFLGIADFLYMSVHHDFGKKHFSIKGIEHLNEALKKEKGVIIATAHFGPFVAMMMRLIIEGYKINALMKPLRGFFAKQMHRSQELIGFGAICDRPVKQCLQTCLEVLKRNEIIFMTIDQNYGAKGRVFVDFFEKKAGTAPGAVLFATKYDVPLLSAYVIPDGKKHWNIVIHPEKEVEKKETEQETIAEGLRVLTYELEDLVRLYPAQWSWMHRRWKAKETKGK